MLRCFHKVAIAKDIDVGTTIPAEKTERFKTGDLIVTDDWVYKIVQRGHGIWVVDLITGNDYEVFRHRYYAKIYEILACVQHVRWALPVPGTDIWWDSGSFTCDLTKQSMHKLAEEAPAICEKLKAHEQVVIEEVLLWRHY